MKVYQLPLYYFINHIKERHGWITRLITEAETTEELYACVRALKEIMEEDYDE